jgi:hypothetical protein
MTPALAHGAPARRASAPGGRSTGLSARPREHRDSPEGSMNATPIVVTSHHLTLTGKNVLTFVSWAPDCGQQHRRRPHGLGGGENIGVIRVC